jgi:hypothetical protein
LAVVEVVELLSSYPAISIFITLFHKVVDVSADGPLSHGGLIPEGEFGHELLYFPFREEIGAIWIILVEYLVYIGF